MSDTVNEQRPQQFTIGHWCLYAQLCLVWWAMIWDDVSMLQMHIISYSHILWSCMLRMWKKYMVNMFQNYSIHKFSVSWLCKIERPNDYFVAPVHQVWWWSGLCSKHQNRSQKGIMITSIWSANLISQNICRVSRLLLNIWHCKQVWIEEPNAFGH